MQHLINHNSSVPMYKQVVGYIKNYIKKNALKPGDKIPAELFLMQELGVSRITIRAAIAEMVDEGLLTRSQGKGTFIAGKKEAYSANDLIGFTHSCQLAGRTPSTQVLSIEWVYPDKRYADLFQVDESEMIIRSRRLRYVDGQPTLIETNHYSPACSFLLDENLKGSLFELFKNKYGIQIINASRTLEITYSTKEEMALLNLKKQTPLLLFEDYQNDQNGKPLYVSKQLYNTENLKFYF